MATAGIPNLGPANIASLESEETITPANDDLVPVIDVSDSNKLKTSTVANVGGGGSGDVTGPASSTDNAIARFDGTGGKTLQNGSATVDDNGSVNVPTGQAYKINNTALAYTDITNSVGSSSTISDNVLLKGDGGTRGAQATGTTVDDSNNVTAVNNLTVNAFMGCDAEYDNGNSGSTKTIDWNNGNYQKVTMTDDCTFTFTAPTGKVGTMRLKLIQDGTGEHAATLPATVRSGGGFALNTSNSDANEIDSIKMDWDGTNYDIFALDYDIK